MLMKLTPDEEKCISEAKSFFVRRGFEPTSLAFFSGPAKHSLEKTDLVRVDGLLREDDAEGAVFNILECRF